MPICENHNKNTPTSVATDVDHADAEIAKAKISREQAYFNSYDFDAIEKVTLDETDDAEEAERTIDTSSSRSSSTSNNNRKQLTDVADTIGKRGKDGVDLDAGHQASSGAYLKRLTSYFSGTISRPNKSLKTLKSPTGTPLAQVIVSDSPSGEDSSENQSEGGVSSTGSTRKLYSGDGDDVSCGATRNNFSLPRAMLKCPSLAGSSSMSSPSTGSVAPDKMCNLSGVFNVPNGKVQCCEKVDGRTRERVISASHYSTDKSGSSGYYSSRVCSTSSVEEHIYSEPVVDIIQTRLVPISKQATLPLQKTLEKQKNEDVGSELEVDQSYYNLRIDSGIRINDELRCLEDSIKNLDRHLKTYSGHSAAPSIRHSELSSPGSSECLVYDEASVISAYDKVKSPRPMPTIMEGTDCGPSSLMTRPSWTEEVDDSLMDIDLDSFRLVSEITNKSLRKGECSTKRIGVDNPTFDKTKVLQEEVLENNYKCSKYVNSCPENAYIVESVIESLVGHDFGTSHAGSEGKTSSYYLKRYEDQIHFQSTKDMLEDIRSKVNKLTTSAMGASTRNSGNSQTNGEHLHANSNHPLPKEFEHYIATLKHELETYLTLMNHCNEMEIKQFCNGLVNNQKLLTITKAFERRRSLASNSSTCLSYEPLRPLSYNPLPYTLSNERIVDDDEDDVTVVSIDSNFQLKRKSRMFEKETILRHSFGTLKPTQHVVDKGGINERISAVHGSSSLKGVPNLTQLQKNLSLQRPMLDKKGAQVGGKDGAGNDKDSMLEWHKNKPSIWEQYYGTNRMNQTLMGKRGQLVKNAPSVLSYPSSRPESDFTLDLPRAEQLRIKMDKEKKFRQRCRILTTFLSLVFFLLTVMVVSLILTRGKRMFGSML